MPLSQHDSQNFSEAIKAARKSKNFTQAVCAELLNYSLSFQRDLERGRYSPSIENFYHICRTLNISADNCIFNNNYHSDSSYHTLMQLAAKCGEDELKILISMAKLLLDTYCNNHS